METTALSNGIRKALLSQRSPNSSTALTGKDLSIYEKLKGHIQLHNWQAKSAEFSIWIWSLQVGSHTNTCLLYSMHLIGKC